jgi:hypothetical protein
MNRVTRMHGIAHSGVAKTGLRTREIIQGARTRMRMRAKRVG